MSLLRKITQTIKILLHPKGGKYIFEKGVSIASFGINDALCKVVPNINTIIDVGANVGQYALASSIFYPEAQIYSFEPVPSTFEKLNFNVKNHKNIKALCFALGDSEGDIDFFQNEHSHASSALEVSDEQKEALPETRNYKKIKVPICRLEDFDFESNLAGPILLKLDVQGFEKQVLQGAGSFLSKVDFLLLEMSFVPMYQDEPLFDEMHQFIRDKGFKLIGPIGFLPSSKNQIMQMDMLYKKDIG